MAVHPRPWRRMLTYSDARHYIFKTAVLELPSPAKPAGGPLRDMSHDDYWDAANEDRWGRLPHEPGYGLAPVVELPARASRAQEAEAA